MSKNIKEAEERLVKDFLESDEVKKFLDLTEKISGFLEVDRLPELVDRVKILKENPAMGNFGEVLLDNKSLFKEAVTIDVKKHIRDMSLLLIENKRFDVFEEFLDKEMESKLSGNDVVLIYEALMKDPRSQEQAQNFFERNKKLIINTDDQTRIVKAFVEPKSSYNKTNRDIQFAKIIDGMDLSPDSIVEISKILIDDNSKNKLNYVGKRLDRPSLREIYSEEEIKLAKDSIREYRDSKSILEKVGILARKELSNIRKNIAGEDSVSSPIGSKRRGKENNRYKGGEI